TFGMAISTYVGQNMGARRLDRVDQGSRVAAVMGLAVSTFLTLLLLLFGGTLLRLFTDTPEIISLGLRQIRILSAGYIAMSVTQVFGGIMRGAGDTMPIMWISMFTTVVFRVPVAYLLAWLTRSEAWPNGSPDSQFISLLSSWVLGAVLTYSWYRRGKWRQKNLVASATAAAGASG
ncbi:MAG TPA: MATE family efflux transporter, partial [Clostridiales bacterium]|nr:MATE family efflux transporter [Clostridiales bacterium]